MTESFARLVDSIHPQSKLVRTWKLIGGISAQVTALEVRLPDGSAHKWIVRQHGKGDRRRNPQIAADEFRLLRALRSVGLPVAAPVAVDHECFDTPVIVVEYIEGSTDITEADLPQFAAHLARIHQISPDAFAFLPQKADLFADDLASRPPQLDDSLQEGRIRDALEAIRRIPQTNATTLLHGDYWQGNVIWQDGQLVGIIDWEDAAVGDPLADLSKVRLELLWAFGVEGMQRFTELYGAQMPQVDLTHLPYWDLFAALSPASRLAEWAEGDVTREQHMRAGHAVFVQQAFAKLNRQS
jgi:aminoglycoside phosphotransferase (APT) family kinase protein